MKPRRALPLLALLPLLAWAAACSPEPRVARIAVAVPLTGDLSAGGQGVRRAVELSVEHARAQGGLPVPVEVVAFDDRAEPDTAVRAARLILADPRVVAVIGHYTSGCSLAAAPIYAAGSLAMLTPAATHPRLTAAQLEPGWPGPRNVFRLVPTDELQADRAAASAVDRGLRRFTVLHDGTPYGRNLSEQFARRLERSGGRVAGLRGVPVGARDYGGLVEKVRADRPEAVFFGGAYPEFGLLLAQARRAGLKVPFLAGDGARAVEVFSLAGDAAEGALFTAPGRPLEKLDRGAEFLDAYRRRYPGAEPGPFDVFAYDAASIALEALRRAGPQRGPLLEALRGTRWRGLAGTTSFDRKGDTTLRSVTLYRASKGRFVPVD
ncbi:MAG: branched-chain amino acid ABC transporter substrate-binding protein [Elusimicrobiota bacterium]|jgi:branched-chain amino acid transport system substrate-binding protein